MGAVALTSVSPAHVEIIAVFWCGGFGVANIIYTVKRILKIYAG